MDYLAVYLIGFNISLTLGLLWRSYKGAKSPVFTDAPQSPKRVLITPSGDFEIQSEGTKRNATINDDEVLWRIENNQG